MYPGVKNIVEKEKEASLLIQQFGDPFRVWQETGLLVPVAGADTRQGYNESVDIPTVTKDGYPIGKLYDEIQQTLRILNARRRPLIDRLSFTVNQPVEGVPQITENDFEEADEFGQPRGIRRGPRWYLGFDMRFWDLGIRYTFRFLGGATADDVRQLHNDALEANERLIYRTVLSRLFRNITDTADLQEGSPPVNVYGFYNGSNPVAPPSYNYVNHTTAHDHFLVSGGAVVDSGDVDAMWDHLAHHGYTEGADVILLVHSQQGRTIRGFRVANGDQYDFIPSANGPSFILNGQIVGGLATSDAELGGLSGFIGKYGNVHVVEEDRIPPGYMVMFASGGLHADRNPIGLRQHENPGLRGLKLIPRFERYPLVESFYHHALGSGVRHRGAGVVMQVKASGAYEVPVIQLGGAGGR